MITEHPPDETLEAFALQPGDDASAAISSHVNGCERCREEIRAIRAFCRELSHRETWRVVDDPPNLAPPATAIRELTDTLAFEDEVATFLLEPMLADPASLRQSLIDDPRYHSAGVVRRLIAVSEGVREESPLRALTMADAAVVLSEHLDSSRYDTELLLSLRGGAWRERANVLRYLGRHPEALAAADHAELAFRKVRVSEVDLARVAYIRSTIQWQMQRLDEALPLARSAARVFTAYGEDARELHAGILEGGILFDMHQPKAAEERFRSLIASARELDDAATLAFLYNALGTASQELGAIGQAAESYREALVLYEHLGMEVEKLRTSWNLALLVVAQGNVARALSMLGQIAEGFERRGCVGDAALVSLDVAEQHAIAGRSQEVRQVCTGLVERFTSAGMMASAVTALQYLRDAAAAERVTPSTVRHVRHFIKRLSHEPALLFAPPAER